MKIQMTVKVVAGLLMVLACSSIFAQMKAVDVFTDLCLWIDNMYMMGRPAVV